MIANMLATGVKKRFSIIKIIRGGLEPSVWGVCFDHESGSVGLPRLVICPMTWVRF